MPPSDGWRSMAKLSSEGAHLRMQRSWRNRRVTMNSLPKAVTDRTHFTAHLVRHCSISKMRQLNGGRWRPRFPAPLRASKGAGVGWKIYGGTGGAYHRVPSGARSESSRKGAPSWGVGTGPHKYIQQLISSENHYKRKSTSHRGAGRSPANKNFKLGTCTHKYTQ